MILSITLIILLLTIPLAHGGRASGRPLVFDKATVLPLRGLLAMTIIVLHVMQRADAPYPLIMQIVNETGMLAVAMFFFISGYGICKSYCAKGSAYLEHFFSRRLGKILPEFIALTLLVMLGCHFAGIYSLETQIHKFIHDGCAPLPFSWFIYAIIYCYISFRISCLLAKSPAKVGLWWTLATLTYMAVTALAFHFPGFWYFTVLSVNCGYLVALYEERIGRLAIRHRAASILSVCALLSVTFLFDYDTGIPRFPYAQYLNNVQAVALFLIIGSLGFAKWEWLNWLGSISLEVYLVHGLPLLLGERVGIDTLWLLIFTFATTIPLAYAASRTYEIMRRKILARPTPAALAKDETN